MKDFKNFVKKNAKESRFLLLFYLVKGGLLFILTIIANRLGLKELTYFNSVFTILSMLEIIAFGTSNGVAVYINQNLKNEDEVKSNFKFGLIITLFTAFILCLIIVLLKNVIFKYIIIFDVFDNYLFFYLMMPAIFLSVLLQYFSHILKQLKEFKFQVLLITIFYVPLLLIIGTVALIKGEGSLLIIAIAYNFVLLVIVPIFLWYILKYKLKAIKIDILKLGKLKIKNKMQKIKTIIGLTLIELVWNLGYTLSFLFLLKKSEMLYNSVSYFNKFLEFANSFYFSFLAVASIRICNKMGENKFDECYRESKFAIYQSILVWIGIAILFLAFSPLLFMGMNAEIVETGRQVFFLILLFQVFKYIEWAFGSYVLTLGGKIKVVLISEIFSLIYFILIFVFADKITNNVFLLVLLISADSFVKIAIELIYFKTKKWLVNVNEIKNGKKNQT